MKFCETHYDLKTEAEVDETCINYLNFKETLIGLGFMTSIISQEV